MKRIVKVERECIDRGIPAEPGSCPIALALQDGPDDFLDVNVQPTLIEIDGTMYHIPQEAKDFIEEFDKLENIDDWDDDDSGSEEGLERKAFRAKFEPFEFMIYSYRDDCPDLRGEAWETAMEALGHNVTAHLAEYGDCEVCNDKI